VTAAAPVYLWQADSASSGSRGVCGELRRAQAAAEGCLREGATGAIVEEASAGLGASSLAGCWCRTGDAWLAVRGAGGAVEWAPVAAA
jgi:hypothetical protein